MKRGEVSVMLLERVNLLLATDLAVLVERAIQLGSLAEVDPYLREAEDHLASLEDAAGVAGQIIEVIQRKLDEHQQKAASLDRAVEAFLLDGNETGAAASQSRLNSLSHLVGSYVAQLREHQRTAERLATAMAALERQHDTLKALRAETQGLLALAHRQAAGPDGAGDAGLDALAPAGDGESRQRAERLAAQLKALRPASGTEDTRHAEQIRQVLDRQRVAAQLAERRNKWAYNAAAASPARNETPPS
jgi:phage shock protein A